MKTDTAAARGEPARLDGVAPLSPAQAAKTLMVLGLLQPGPKHGYELHRIVVAHGSLYPDFKKPTLYHLLHRLTGLGAVRVHAEGGARGPRGERLVFALTPKGATLFLRLLRHALGTYEAAPTSFEVALAYLDALPRADAQLLLRQRRAGLRARRAEVAEEIDRLADQHDSRHMMARRLATDHSLNLLDADIAWLDRAMRQLAATAARRAAGARAQANGQRVASA